MKFLIVFVALCSCAVYAAPAVNHQQANVETILYESDVQPEGYKFAYGTSDGTEHVAQAHVKNLGTEQEALTVSGSYHYIGDDGQTYEVKYTADENGFQPQGAHLPVA